MENAARIENSLRVALATCRGAQEGAAPDAGDNRVRRSQASIDASVHAPLRGPTKLADAMEYAVFPGGGRIRPMLCLAVAQAGGDRDGRLVLAAATALELLHCASLVHDDLPCFDDANLRRGKPSVHRAFGEPLAVLAGDALIMLAVETVVRAAPAAPEKLAPMLTVITRAIGMPHGIIAGQAWESEPDVDIKLYHQTKTAALFVAACSAGAVGAGLAPGPWAKLGSILGEAYQLMDDLTDRVGAVEVTGKPVGQDARLGRPNGLDDVSPQTARRQVEALMQKAVLAIPDSAGSQEVERLLRGLAGRFISSLSRVSAA